MSLNIPNLDKLIAHLEVQPPERINMADMSPDPKCGCILTHALLVFPEFGDTAYDIEDSIGMDLYMPPDYFEERHEVKRYPAHRVIATLKRLRDRFLATGEIVVDWGPEPGDEPTQTWAAPQATELTPPALPDEITRLLAPALTPSEA